MVRQRSPAEGLADEFEKRYGRRPEGVWSAPGRVNLVGEHTDYNLGYVLPFAIADRAYVAVGRRAERRLGMSSLQYPGEPVEVDLDDLRPGSLRGWSRYVAGVVWAYHRRGMAGPGVDLILDGRVPAGAGLSSSASIECAVEAAYGDLLGRTAEPVWRAQLAQKAENDFVGVPCGLLDQMASVGGVEGHALFFDTLGLAVRPVPLDPERSGLALIVADTGVAHALADGGYAARRADCEAAASLLGAASLRQVPDLAGQLDRLEDPVLARRARHVASENQRVLDVVDSLAAGDWTRVGQAMYASHASLRDDYEVSCPELDLTVECLRAAGALGARLTGGGFGGSVVALVAAERVDSATAALGESFTRAGLAPPRVRAVRAGPGARAEQKR